MKAAFLEKPRQIRLREIPIPSIGLEDVLVRTKSVGICGSDFHYWKTGTIGSFTIREPQILGHELSGEVAEIGKNVTNLKVGDRVIVEPGAPCRKCRFCKIGRYNLCSTKRFMSDPPTPGAFAEYVAWPSDLVYKLPDNMSFDEGALVEPFAVGVYAVNRAQVALGDIVMIMGAGPVGQMALQAAINAGASQIYVADIDDWRLERATALGATAAINARGDVFEQIQALTGANFIDATIEASGSMEATNQAVKITRRGGTIVLLGLYEKTEFTYSLLDVLMKELTVTGSYDYANVFPRSLALMASRKFDANSLITHHLPIEEIEKGFTIIDKKTDHVLKVLVHP
jgi:L-iditol 2-dehydrogenase